MKLQPYTNTKQPAACVQRWYDQAEYPVQHAGISPKCQTASEPCDQPVCTEKFSPHEDTQCEDDLDSTTM